MEALGAPATLQLELSSAPESVALVRAALKGFAAPLRLDLELLDDLQMATSEACNNVVRHAYGGAPGPLDVSLAAARTGVEVVVRDQGRGIGELPAHDSTGLGLPLIRSLADEMQLTDGPEGGAELRMHFARAIPALEALGAMVSERPRPPSSLGLTGTAAASVAPVSVLPGVLGRLARSLAGEARFSIERFSELQLVVDALARLAERFSIRGAMCFALDTETRQMQLRIGPFRRRPGMITGGWARDEIGPLLGGLVDELEVEPVNGAELLRLTMTEDRLAPAGFRRLPHRPA